MYSALDGLSSIIRIQTVIARCVACTPRAVLSVIRSRRKNR
jgi:hypothetical protein